MQQQPLCVRDTTTAILRKMCKKHYCVREWTMTLMCEAIPYTWKCLKWIDTKDWIAYHVHLVVCGMADGLSKEVSLHYPLRTRLRMLITGTNIRNYGVITFVLYSDVCKSSLCNFSWLSQNKVKHFNKHAYHSLQLNVTQICIRFKYDNHPPFHYWFFH